MKRNDSMHVYHQSTCTLLKNNFSSTLAHGQRRSHTVTHSRTSPHTVGHGRTSSHRYFAQQLPYTVEHGHTYDHTRSNMVTQNLFLPNTIAHGHTDTRTRSHTVTQTTVHGRTRLHKKSSAARMAYPPELCNISCKTTNLYCYICDCPRKNLYKCSASYANTFILNEVRLLGNTGECTRSFWTHRSALFLLFLIARMQTCSHCICTGFHMDSHIHV